MSQKALYQLSVRQILLIALLSATMAALAVVGFTALSNKIQLPASAENAANNLEAAAPAGISDPRSVNDEQNNIEVYRTLAPGVAFIKTTSYEQDDFGNVEEGRGSGSGSVIDQQGHILTNDHVVAGATRVTVNLGGDRVYQARVVGSDPDTDLAVIKLENPPAGLTLVPFGDSDELIVGQKVLAIGNPFGFDRTLTTGVVSGLQRTIRSRPQQGFPRGKPIEGAVQTDASINPGNSGGPLLDSRGRMIGINSQILSPGGGSVGVGFAVSVNVAKRVVPQLIQFGEVRRPKLGISPVNISSLVAQGIRMPLQEGVFVRGVYPNGPAQTAGIRGLEQSSSGDVVLGDIITAIDGEKVTDTDDYYRALDKRQINDTIQVEVFRDNRRITIPVRLSALPTQPQRQPNAAPRRF